MCRDAVRRADAASSPRIPVIAFAITSLCDQASSQLEKKEFVPSSEPIVSESYIEALDAIPRQKESEAVKMLRTILRLFRPQLAVGFCYLTFKHLSLVSLPA